MRRLFLALALCLAASAALATATLLPNGEQQFSDQNGQPYGAGRVYFYIPNTLTPKVTWQDPAQATPNSQPVVLDSAGRAVIYGNGNYRQILKDVFGNTIWDKLTQGFGSGGANINPTITGATTVVTCAGFFPIDNTAGADITITMPTNPGDGDYCQFADSGYNAGTYQITFNFGSKVLNSGRTTYPMAYNGQVVGFTWLSGLAVWQPN